jgi:energy-coupling factor transporter ATP-binding protein EcfA2
MNLWTVPAADEASLLNIPKSLSNSIASPILTRFGLPTPQFAWGAKTGTNNTTNVVERMKPGDICLFYTISTNGPGSRYNYAGRIASTKQNRELAQAIWGNPDFELVYLMDETWPISMTIQEWAQIAGYAPRAPQGLSRVGDPIRNSIIASFGSLERWARSLNPSGTQQTPPSVQPSLPVQQTLIQQVKQPEAKSAIDVTQYIYKYAISRAFRFGISSIRRLLASLKAKPFVILAGNSGTGKSRLVRLFAEASGATVANGRFTMIPVRPDWNDSSELLGFFDLGGSFIPGQLIAPILLAHRNPERPFFVCLDEMNLARVEHYFSDFLSIIESRRKDGSAVTTDPILKEAHLQKMKADGLSPAVLEALNHLKARGQALGLPANLYVVGTVNMDETTQPFSRKVLDRANTIEFNDIDLLQGLDEDVAASEVPPLDLGQAFFRPEFTTLNDLLPAHRDKAKVIAQTISDLNQDLGLAGFEVGYRVRDEATSFAVYASDAGLSDEEVNEAIVLQKILPRVQGSSPRVEKLLMSLLKRLKGDSDVPDENDPELSHKLAALRVDDEASAIVRKIAGMLILFREENFTSFWLA